MNEKYKKYVRSAIVFCDGEFEEILSSKGIKAEYTFEGFNYTDENNEYIDEESIIEYLSELFGVTVLKIFTDSEWSEDWNIWIEYI